MSLSPDGRYIAYDSPQAEEGPERDIFLLASDGSREVPLVRHPGHDAGPMWTPDGSRVLFFSDRGGALGLWSVSVAEGRPQGAPALDPGQCRPNVSARVQPEGWLPLLSAGRGKRSPGGGDGSGDRAAPLGARARGLAVRATTPTPRLVTGRPLPRLPSEHHRRSWRGMGL